MSTPDPPSERGLPEPGLSRVRSALRRLVLLRPGELGPLLWSGAYFFFLLSGYYMLRPVRETMGIGGGADKLPWLMTGTMAAMFLASPLFSALVSRVPRRRFIPLTYRFFMANILVFYALLVTLPDAARINLGYAFYIWLSVYNLFAVSVFWAFMADMFTREQAKRLFGAIGVGGTLGAIAGAAFTGAMVEQIGTAPLLLISVVLIELAVQCVRRLTRIFGIDRPPAPLPPVEPLSPAEPLSRAVTPRAEPLSRAVAPIAPQEPGPGAFAGLTLIARSPYLLQISLYMLLYAITSTFLYLEQARIVQETFPDRAARTAAFAGIDLWANVLTLLVQLFLTGRIISLIGIGGALTLLPLLTIFGFTGLAAWPTFAVLAAFQVLRRGLHYAVDRPAREVLFTVLGPDEKYKSKSFIDTFVYRTGDLIGAWAPLWVTGAGFALGVVAVPLAVGWLASGVVLGAMQRAVTPKPGRL